MSPNLAVECLSLGDPTQTAQGGKVAPFSVNGGPAEFNLHTLRCAFEPAAYKEAEATRVNMVFKVPCHLEGELGAIDEWILTKVTEDSVKYFGKQKTREQLQEIYTPCLKQSEKWGSQFKVKVNLPGSSGAVRVWSAEKEARAPPEAWTGCVVEPRVRFRHLYFMGNQFGPVIDLTDARIVAEPQNECPF